jgi:hypothetical protein
LPLITTLRSKKKPPLETVKVTENDKETVKVKFQSSLMPSPFGSPKIMRRSQIALRRERRESHYLRTKAFSGKRSGVPM